MSIIPISPDTVLTHKCEDGTELYFRYLTGEHRAKYQDVQQSLYVKAKPYAAEAKKLAVKRIAELKKSVRKQSRKKIVIPSLEMLAARISIELAQADGAITDGDQDRQTAAYIDLFLVDWKKDGAPSRDPKILASEYFTPTSTTEIMEILTEYIQELMGLSVDDQKN